MKNHWNLALTTSLAIHTIILTGIPVLHHTNQKIKPPENKKITELKINPEKIEKIITKKNQAIKLKNPPPFIDNVVQKIMPKNENTLSLTKPKVIQEKMRKVVLSEKSPNDKNLKKMPAYIDYYRMIREKIRENAYHYYSSSKEGEVFLSFIITKEGALETLSLDEKSISSTILKKIALKSVEQASPFPSFPEDLKNYARLQFNISIYFKNN